jgi:CubicO group peptidase (beta-lactamase class C family)
MKVHADPGSLGFSIDRLTRINLLMDRYIDSSKLAGVETCVVRHGQSIHRDVFGFQDLEAKTPLAENSIFRIYSMTKPITAVALMMLYEESLFNLTDPVSKFIPDFENVKVWGEKDKLEDQLHPMTVQDLLRHTAGMSYGGHSETLSHVDKLYDDADIFNTQISLAEFSERVASIPLRFQPCKVWHYSISIDIAGYLVELLAGKPLGEFMQERIFDPLGMMDTGFEIDPSAQDRFCTLYGKTSASELAVLDLPESSVFLPPVKLQAGGAGLVSTTDDYLRFAGCILNKGELDGVRLLGPRTVEMMTCNHLPLDLLPIAYEGSEPMLGMGYGLGFGVMLDPAQAGMMGSVGDHGWGGYAETYFWIDPREDLIAILMCQYQPSQTYPIRKEFRAAVYQSLIS